MKVTKETMGMPAAVTIPGDTHEELIERVFSLWSDVDARFSMYRPESEVSRVSRDELFEDEYSEELSEVLALGERTSRETLGYFNMVRPDGILDPTGIVKGWALDRAAALLQEAGVRDFLVEIAGDAVASGVDETGSAWKIGISNPFTPGELVKVLALSGVGIATSGTAERGQHIYNPYAPNEPISDIISTTVVAASALDADRFATAAFAMGSSGIQFLEAIEGLEAYQIDTAGIATETSHFQDYVAV